MVGVGQWLDLILEVFSNLNDSMIPYISSTYKLAPEVFQTERGWLQHLLSFCGILVNILHLLVYLSPEVFFPFLSSFPICSIRLDLSVKEGRLLISV